MDRLALGLLTAALLVSCAPEGKDLYDAWNPAFANAPDRFGHVTTGLWVARYLEDPTTHRFTRSSAWGEVPEKLLPDGQGGWTVAVPILVQTETSDGPLPDRFQTVLVRLVQSGNRFTLAPNDALPGNVTGWTDQERRTVWLRGEGQGPEQVLWQFQGRY